MKIKNKKFAIAILSMALCIGLLASALAVLWIQRTIDFSLSITTHGDFRIYEDAECTILYSMQDFGEIDVSTGAVTLNEIIYLKNEGNTPINLLWTMTVLDGWEINLAQTGYSRYNEVSEMTGQFFIYYGLLANGGRWLPSESTYVETATFNKTKTIPYQNVVAMEFSLVIAQNILAETMTWQITIDGTD